MGERLNRDRVIANAATLADQIGLDHLTFTRLAKDLGIAPPGVYRHASDITDLRSGIAQQASRSLARALASATSGLSGRDALAAMAREFRRWARTHPGQYAALQIAPDLDDAPGQAAATELLNILETTLREYALSGDDLIDAIRFIRSTLHGFVTLELNAGFKQPRSIDDTFQHIIDALDATLRPRGRNRHSRTRDRHAPPH